ncbi:molybdenum cofactor guanylyltransferase [Sphingomonas immobilis]|uniref:Molybdenum cofactor guanylyltransferase n=1 Tax=Sphingomonas immobilis TaxID=3063997 RepID=A0ABT8ZWD2_9SPHN|nr:molybdenum cofactor guanylyltransferase [Sphingomonas sp. CA1-15]MDO7841883.1 molybdenum cofactor guanylyltransferase [Sphingomonas sp. CA1-15]
MTDRILGAVIAGGRSRRFGSDKALVMIAGRPMIDHVIAALRPQVDGVIVCGRAWPGLTAIADERPGRLGPLAGLEAALRHAVECGYAAVLSVPVDTLPLPGDLPRLLASEGPATFRKQLLIGYWPIDSLPALSRYLDAGDRSLHGWIAVSGARAVDEPISIFNINHEADLSALDT